MSANQRTSASIPVNNTKNSGKHRQQHRYELSVIFSYLYHYLFFLSSNNLSDPTIQLLLFSFFIHHSSACNAVQASGKKRQPSLPELRAACKRNHLKIAGNKIQLKKRLLNPDSYRVMCGGVSLKLTSDFEIEHLHTIKQRYKQIGHPNKKNIKEWHEHLVGFTGKNSHIYAMTRSLKNANARFDDDDALSSSSQHAAEKYEASMSKGKSTAKPKPNQPMTDLEAFLEEFALPSSSSHNATAGKLERSVTPVAVKKIKQKKGSKEKRKTKKKSRKALLKEQEKTDEPKLKKQKTEDVVDHTKLLSFICDGVSKKMFLFPRCVKNVRVLFFLTNFLLPFFFYIVRAVLFS